AHARRLVDDMIFAAVAAQRLFCVIGFAQLARRGEVVAECEFAPRCGVCARQTADPRIDQRPGLITDERYTGAQQYDAAESEPAYHAGTRGGDSGQHSASIANCA